MNRVLILMAGLFLVLMMVSCGGDDSSEKSGLGESCTKTPDCENGLKCIDLVCVSDSGDTGDTGNTTNDMDTGDSDNIGNTGDTGNSGATCTGSDKFCHSHDGLNWSDASSDYMTWDEAITYCENLGGRLPTISELRTLIQNCPGTETGGECGVTDSCLSYTDCWNESSCYSCEYDENNPGKYSVFGDSSWFWSSSERSDYADNAWRVDFYCGSVRNSYKGSNGYCVRCVH